MSDNEGAPNEVVDRPPSLRLRVDNPKPFDFVNATTQWADWLTRFTRFRNITGLADQPDQIQIDSLLFIMGPESEGVYAQLVFDGEEDTRTYDQVIAAFTRYFQPRRNVLNYRTQFYNRRQAADESAEEYIRCIHGLAVKCRFNEGLTQSDMIKDRLLSGMTDTLLSSELQLDEDVTLDTVTSKMRAKEAIDKQMKTESMVAAVKTLSKSGSSKKQASQQTINNCRYCGRSHPVRACPAYGKKCNICSKSNHFAKVCSQNKQASEVQVEQPAVNDSPEFYISTQQLKADAICSETVYTDGFDVDPGFNVLSIDNEWFLDFYVNGNVMNAKIDTGAQTNVISCDELRRLLPKAIIKPTSSRLTAYSGHALPVLGVSEVGVVFRGQQHSLNFHVIGDERRAHTLIGLPSIKRLGILNVSVVGYVGQTEEKTGKNSLVEEFADVFTGFGKLKTTHTITLKPGAVPFVCPPRSVPHALRDKLKIELDRLVSLEIIKQCSEPSEWLNQIVPVLKPDGSLRVCLDPQQLNSVTVRDRYILPTVSDIYARLSGSSVFSTLDAQSGFHQIPIDEKSSKLTTFLTPFGKYQYLRLPFGLTSAPEFFHKTMVDLVGDIQGVEVYIDDVLVHARSEIEHDARLREVLSRFRNAGLKLNSKKCHFKQSSVKFLGNILSKEGIMPSPDKVRAIEEVKVPTNKSEIRSFLGMVTYLAKFCKNLSELTKPLRELVKDKVDFCWETSHEKAFNEIKQTISHAPVLALYNPSEEVVVNVDASSHSLGAVLLQKGQPIEFAAQSLTNTQCLYAQVEKEMLAIQFGLTRFHQYVYGRKVTVESDHQPLVRISKKPLSDLTPRLQRMRMQIQHYDYSVVHVPGRQMYVSDYLSRSCKSKTYEIDLHLDDPMPQICAIRVRDATSVEEYTKATMQDTTLALISQYTQSGWPKQKRLCHALAKPYWNFRDEISECNGLLFYGDRLIIPHQMKSEIIERLHASHQGVTKTQQRARTAVFWPGMNIQIEDKIMSCNTCKSHENAQPQAPLIPSEIPEYPWQVLGSDLFQIAGANYLLNVDYYSKWVNVTKLTDLSGKSVVDEFRKQLSEYGQPAVIRSDNGPQYTSREFRDFTRQNGIQHVTSSPGFPRSNGQVERSVQTVKKLMIKANEEGQSFWNSLLMLRNTPIEGGLPSPAQLLQGRSLFDGIPVQKHCLFPRAYNRAHVHEKLALRQNTMKSNHDLKSTTEKPVLSSGQNVRFKATNAKWERAIVQGHHESNRSYLVKNQATGIVLRRNRQQLKPDLTGPSPVQGVRLNTQARAERSVLHESSITRNEAQVGIQASKTVKPVQNDRPVSHSNTQVGVGSETTETAKSSSPSAHTSVTGGAVPLGAPPTPVAVSQAPERGHTPVTKTRFGRNVRKPLRYRDE